MKIQTQYNFHVIWDGIRDRWHNSGMSNLSINNYGCKYQHLARVSIWDYLKLDDHCDTLIHHDDDFENYDSLEGSWLEEN